MYSLFIIFITDSMNFNALLFSSFFLRSWSEVGSFSPFLSYFGVDGVR